MLYRSCLIVLLVSLIMIPGCSKKKEEAPAPAPKISDVIKTPVARKSPKLNGVRPYNYSDKSTWKNGINIKLGNQFFINIEKTEPSPIKVGNILTFPSIGDAVVKSVTRLEYKNYSSIFVNIDKKMDPVADGFPHPFTQKGIIISATAFNQDNLWKNGIHLKDTNTFMFVGGKNEKKPFNIGDTAIFTGAKETKITSISTEPWGANDFCYYIKVNKALSPVDDGAPKKITIIFTK